MVEKVFDNYSIGKSRKFSFWKFIDSAFVHSHLMLFLLFIQIQFAGALILGFNGLRIDCEFPLWMQYTLCGYMVSFLVSAFLTFLNQFFIGFCLDFLNTYFLILHFYLWELKVFCYWGRDKVLRLGLFIINVKQYLKSQYLILKLQTPNQKQRLLKRITPTAN